MRIQTSALIISVGIALAGCSNKPPGCADPEVATTAKSMLIGKMTARGSTDIDDPHGDLLTFFDALQVRLINVVDDGYESQTKKQSCKAKMQVTYGASGGFERQVAYSTQRTVDNKDNFILEMSDGQVMATTVQSDAMEYYNSRRWAGEWQGDYSCTGVADAVDGPEGPYKVPVVMVVSGTAALLERTTVGGGYEKLSGHLKRGSFKLSGAGKNSLDDQWTTYFHGEPVNGAVEAQGGIRLPDGREVRSCTLTLLQAPRQKP